jgi:hypothetical protein
MVIVEIGNIVMFKCEEKENKVGYLVYTFKILEPGKHTLININHTSL